MPETIILTIGAEVASGPTLKESRTLTVDAYDKISVTVPDGTSSFDVELQPGGAGSVRLLIIKSSQYGDALTYTVNCAVILGLGSAAHKARHNAHGDSELLRTTQSSIGDALLKKDMSGRLT